MTAAAADDAGSVRAIVLERLAGVLAGLDRPPVDPRDDVDLLGEGVVDSFGLLELVASVERAFDVSLDPDAADGAPLTTVGGLCAHVAAARGGARTLRALPRPEAAAARRRLPARAGQPPAAAALAAYRFAVRARDKGFSLAVGRSFAAFGGRTVLQLPVRLVGERRIAIGSGCFVGANSWLQVLGDGPDVALSIGDGASIAGHCVLSAVSDVTIGDGVSFARGVYVADHGHAYDGTAPVRDGVLDDRAAVTIGNGVWLGENVVVLPGATIGARAVIGAGSVVHGEIPPYALALGAPARVVRLFGPSDAHAARA